MFDEKEFNYSKLIPFVYWAQNNSSVFLKFELADIDENNLKMSDDSTNIESEDNYYWYCFFFLKPQKMEKKTKL